jgi:hypothetical protein
MHPDATTPAAIALIGLILGVRHATDPDHVVAVTAILSRERRLGAATRVGIIWGLGHTLTVLAVGAAIIVFKLAIPTRLGLAMEFAVAVVLILLGVGAAVAVMREAGSRWFGLSPGTHDAVIVHSHAHTHDDTTHRHPHLHVHAYRDHQHDVANPDAIDHAHLPADAAVLADDEIGRFSSTMTAFAQRRPLLRSFAVGLVHGLAGSAAIALLVLSAIPDPIWATLYLAVFCVGTIIGMGLITTAIATPFMLAARRTAWLHRGLVTSSGLLSFGFGLFLAYQIGVVDRLFGVAPIWIPH